jgi:hypothetical protein
MEISPALGVVLMMNNYFHDVATALLAASAWCIYALVRTQAEIGEPVATLFYLKTYRRMITFFRFAVYWIIIGGIPRTIFYTRFEWANAAGKGQVPALIVKHVLMVVCVVLGVYAWRRLKSKAAMLEASLPKDLAERM